MAKIPEPTDTIAARIYKTLEDKAAKELPRQHLGASLIGHHCDRFIWLSFRWAFANEFEGRILRLFRRGQDEESKVFQDLTAAGIEVKPFNNGKQWSIKDGHFGGSLDGIIMGGIPEAPLKQHVLEIKTHSKKSFDDLEKQGVKKSKPQHYAQMQVYMMHTGIDRALYFAVCKDDDRIYTERVRLDKTEAQRLTDKAQRIIASDRQADPVSRDPSWYQCKMCPGYDLCHGSKLTKQINCRTCCYSTPQNDGTWHCDHWQSEIPADALIDGCDNHLLHPDLVPGWAYNNGWVTPLGVIDTDKFSSKEIVANWQACAVSDPNIDAIKKAFGAKVIS